MYSLISAALRTASFYILEYKANREEMPEALEKQIEPLKLLTRAMGLVGVEQHGVESGRPLLRLKRSHLRCKGPRRTYREFRTSDFAQIVNDKIKLMLPPPTANPKLGWRIREVAGGREKFGVSPDQIADYLAIVGDTSDNIPELNGAGAKKTASKWLEEHRNLEGVISNASGLKPDRFRELVASSVERLRMNLRLTTLNLALPVSDAVKGAPNAAELFRLLEEMEMRGCLTDARERYGQPELF